MKGELKAGGLALVIKSDDASDVGKCVTLVHIVEPGQTYRSPVSDHVCRHRIEYPPAWVVTGDIETGPGGLYGWAVFDPKNLLPIDGDDHQERDQLAKDKPREVVA